MKVIYAPATALAQMRWPSAPGDPVKKMGTALIGLGQQRKVAQGIVTSSFIEFVTVEGVHLSVQHSLLVFAQG